MRTLIVFATQHGAAADCAASLAGLIGGESDVRRLGRDRIPALDEYDQVVIGGSIHIGKIQKQVTRFTTEQQQALLGKRLGLFICCMAEGETADQQLKDAFPEPVYSHAVARGIFGGCYRFSQMSWLNRKMIQMIEKQQTGSEINVNIDIDKLKPDEIEAFARALNADLTPAT